MKKSLFKKQFAISLGIITSTVIIPVVAIACNNDSSNLAKSKDVIKQGTNQKNSEESKTIGFKKEGSDASKKSELRNSQIFFKRDQSSNYLLSLSIPNTHGKHIQVKIKSTLDNEIIESTRALSVSNKVDLPFLNLKENNSFSLLSINAFETNTSTKPTSIQIPNEYKNRIFKTKPIYATAFVDQEAFNTFETTTLQQKSTQAFKNLDNYNSQQWYDFENDFYLTILYNHYSANGSNNFNPLLSYDNGVKVTDKQKQFFDDKAKSLSQESYDKAALKGFTLPIYRENSNEVLGLSLKEGNSTLQHSALASSSTNATGTPRVLGGEKYKDIALQTISINFIKPINGQNRTVSGTMWILDFVPKDDGSYPTKWYFATNAHVARELLTPVSGISFTFLKPSSNIAKTQKLIKLDSDYTMVNVPTDKDHNFINTIYTATDFLTTKPSDFLTPQQAEKYKNTDEFIDFAVFEVDFEKLAKVNGAFIQQGGQPEENKETIKTAPELAKLVTNEYATKTDKHIKFLKTSYLKDYQKIDGPILDNTKWKDYLYAVGYPVVGAEQIDNTTDRAGNALWTNSFYKLLNDEQRNDQKYQNLGNLLSKQLGYRSFINKAGIVDGFIAIPKTDAQPLRYGDKHYWNMALEYSLFNFAAGGGSSGSSVRNQNNEIVGIIHLGNQGSLLSVAAALRSEGYNYNGLYGKYNLAQYDLIYGGAEKQKTSYRQALADKYGNDFKTNIFKNTVKTIPTDFIFKKTS